MTDIARRAGVSKNSVSLALRGSPQIPKKPAGASSASRSPYYKEKPTVAHLMAGLRKVREPAFQSTLGLLNANVDPSAFTRHPTIPTYVAGCHRRANQLGYNLDEFWLHNPPSSTAGSHCSTAGNHLSKSFTPPSSSGWRWTK